MHYIISDAIKILHLRIEAVTPNAELRTNSLSNAELKQQIEKAILEISLLTLESMTTTIRSAESTGPAMTFLLELTQFGREISSVGSGSITFSIMCPTVEALDDLYELTTSGKLNRMAIDAYITEEYPQGTTLNMTIDETEWKRCRAELLSAGEGE